MNPNDIKPEDTIAIVRMCIKMSDCLNEYDDLEYLKSIKENKRYRHEIRHAINDWGKEIDLFSSKFLIPFTQSDEKTCVELTTYFRDLSDSIKFRTEEETSILLIYAKCASILIDISPMEYTDQDIQRVVKKTYAVLHTIENKWMQGIQLVTSEGYDMKQVIIGFNQLGRKIMYNEPQENE